ncbi:MAG: AAA family ATPase [Dehalococcoidales bacterium]|nr:AAA family ATPase [Dehalococcoidales bacterium]
MANPQPDNNGLQVISKPIVEDIIGGYKFLWCEGKEQVFSAYLKHIYQNGGKAIYAEVTIEHEFEEFPKLANHRFNLLSTRARTDLTKRMEALQLPFEINWTDLVEQICTQTIDRLRLGEPVKTYWVDYQDEMEPPEYLLKPFILKGVPNVLFGEKGVRKSGLTLLIAACLGVPWTDNPLGLKVPIRPVKSLILDWETEFDIIKYEARRLQKGMNMPTFPINYRRCSLPLTEDLDQIQQHVADTEADILFIDSLGAAAGGELNKPDIALNFFSALRSLKKTSWIIAQTSKGEGTDKRSIFGSTYFTYYARSIFEITRSDSDFAGNEMHIGVFHRWCNLAKLNDPLGISVKFSETGDSVSMEKEELSIVDFMSKVSTSQKIVEILKRSPKTTEELVNLTGLKRNTIDKAMERLRVKKQIIRSGDGEKWGLITRNYEPSDNHMTRGVSDD